MYVIQFALYFLRAVTASNFANSTCCRHQCIGAAWIGHMDKVCKSKVASIVWEALSGRLITIDFRI